MKRTIRRRTRAPEFRAVTLAEMAGQGIDILCWCHKCHHHSVMGSLELIGRLGPSYSVPAIGSRMVCSACGGRDVATRPAWPAIGVVTSHEGIGDD